MQDLRTILSEEQLRKLREAYDPRSMRAAMLDATIAAYPLTRSWNEAIESTFYGDGSPLPARDRERCLIALLSSTNSSFSLAIHSYWGLMEGLTPSELCHIAALAACYRGVSNLGQSMPTIARLLRLLKRVADTNRCDSQAVVGLIASEFTTQ